MEPAWGQANHGTTELPHEWPVVYRQPAVRHVARSRIFQAPGSLFGILAFLVLFAALACSRRVTAAPTAGPLFTEKDWTIEISGPGTAVVRYQNVEVLGMHYNFWGKDWSWASGDVNPDPRGGNGEPFVIEVPVLGLTIHGSIRKGPGELTFTYTIESTMALHDVVGGGMEFNLKLDSPLFAGVVPEMALLPDRRGFRWTVADGREISAVFDQPIAGVSFEQGRREQIRFYLAGHDIQPGKTTRTLTIRLPSGGTVRPSVADRYGVKVAADWAPDTLPWDRWPIDVSFLSDGDRPAGRHGRLRARGDQLVFEDGTVARLWGTNVVAYALFHGEHAQIATQAKRLAALGYNLVRIHHHDSEWVSPNVFSPGTTTQKLNDAALDNIDWWVKCLRDEGIYVWLDLKVGRTFRPGDGIPGFDELTRGEPTGRGFDFVDPRLQELERQFAAQYLSRVNRYTHLSYLKDPAVIAALVTNEDDLTMHFGNQMLPDHHNRVHESMLRGLVKKSAAALNVSATDAMRLWLPGPAKLVLADLEVQFFKRSIADLRRLGFGGLVAGTSYWGGESLFSLPSLAVGDVIDVHSYGDPEALGANPRVEANFIAWIGAAQISGKPLSISEWNVPYPTRDRFTAPLYLAAISDLQGWDAPMIFSYSQDEVGLPSSVGQWSTGYDPALTALMPAASILFRQQHVRQARKTYRFEPSRETVYGRNLNPDTSATLRTLVEQSRLVVALPDLPEVDWDDRRGPKEEGAIVVTEPDRDFIPPGQNKVQSDTGELERDWVAGTHTIDTPMSQAAAGWIGGHPIALHDVEIRIQTAKATVALTSLDSQPIAASKRILLTVVGQVAASPGDKLPFLAQPVVGSVVLRSSQASMSMTPLVPGAAPPVAGDPSQSGGWKAIAATREGTRHVFTLPRQPVTHWFLLQPASRRE